MRSLRQIFTDVFASQKFFAPSEASEANFGSFAWSKSLILFSNSGIASVKAA
jgi:hypothetical protein